MRIARILFFIPLLLGAGSVVLEPGRAFAPGLIFVILIVYVHASARIIGVSGTEKAMLALETLPFFCLGATTLGRLDPLQTLLMSGSATAMGGALLAGEVLLMNGAATFTTSLGFIVACGLGGAALHWLPVPVVLGFGLLALTLTSYGVLRRARG